MVGRPLADNSLAAASLIRASTRPHGRRQRRPLSSFVVGPRSSLAVVLACICGCACSHPTAISAATPVSERSARSTHSTRSHKRRLHEDGEEGVEHCIEGHEHEGHGHAGHAHGHEHHVSGGDISIAAMLIGIVVTQICLFYLILNDDPDVRSYTWDMLHTGLSIYLSVSLFVATRNLMGALFAEEGINYHIDLFLCFFFWCFLQVVLIFSTKIKNDPTGGSGDPATASRKSKTAGASRTLVTHERPEESFNLPYSGSRSSFIESQKYVGDNPEVSNKEIAVLAFGTVASHLLAFACLHLFAEIQVFLANVEGVWGACGVGVLPIAVFLGLVAMMRLAQVVRFRIATSDDHLDKDEEEWLECGNEAEMEACSLVVSFLVTQAFRFYIGGVMPDKWGLEHGSDHPWYRVFLFVLLSVSAQGLAVGRALLKMKLKKKPGNDPLEALDIHHEEFKPPSFFEDSDELFGESLTFICGWSFLICIVWTLQKFLPGAEGQMANLVCGAIICTYTVFALIPFLDTWVDVCAKSAKTHDDLKLADKIGRVIISACGTTVGFSWERCFDESFHTVAHYLEAGTFAHLNEYPRKVCALACVWLLALLILVVALPALYWYICPFVLRARWFHRKSLEELKHNLTKDMRKNTRRRGNRYCTVLPEDLMIPEGPDESRQ